MRINRKAVSLLMSAVAVILFAVAVSTFERTKHFVADAARAQATIIELIPQTQQTSRIDQKDSNPANQQPAYFSVFSFTDAAGASHIVQSKSATYPPPGQVGQTITVLYRPDAPNDARVNSFISLCIVPLITGGLALLYLPAALLIWFWPRMTVYVYRRGRRAAREG